MKLFIIKSMDDNSFLLMFKTDSDNKLFEKYCYDIFEYIKYKYDTIFYTGKQSIYKAGKYYYVGYLFKCVSNNLFKYIKKINDVKLNNINEMEKQMQSPYKFWSIPSLKDELKRRKFKDVDKINDKDILVTMLINDDKNKKSVKSVSSINKKKGKNKMAKSGLETAKEKFESKYGDKNIDWLKKFKKAGGKIINWMKNLDPFWQYRLYKTVDSDKLNLIIKKAKNTLSDASVNDKSKKGKTKKDKMNKKSVVNKKSKDKTVKNKSNKKSKSGLVAYVQSGSKKLYYSRGDFAITDKTDSRVFKTEHAGLRLLKVFDNFKEKKCSWGGKPVKFEDV